tara:strand:+ start:26 stop:718 length:693 start_codon:yes stop_codon:yes gene_type:complete
MKNNSDYKTYLLVKLNKLAIVVLNFDNKILFKNETLIDNSFNFEILNNFLNKNIFKIEKLLREFVNNIFLIIDHHEFYSTKLSIKDKTENILLNTDSINSLLLEAKNQCNYTLEGNDIIHMKIDNFKIDDVNYDFLPNKMGCKKFSIEVSFICLPKRISQNFKKVLNNYQISLIKMLSYQYLLNFNENKDDNIYEVAQKILNGLNENEVFMSYKSSKNQGFFEKFFNFFN